MHYFQIKKNYFHHLSLACIGNHIIYKYVNQATKWSEDPSTSQTKGIYPEPDFLECHIQAFNSWLGKKPCPTLVKHLDFPAQQLFPLLEFSLPWAPCFSSIQVYTQHHNSCFF